MSIKNRTYRFLLKLLIRERMSGSGQLNVEDDTVYVLEKPYTADRLILENKLNDEHVRWRPDSITAVNNQHPDHLRLQIEHLVSLQRNEPDKRIKLQPIMVLFGHLPGSQQTLLKSALSESWRSDNKLKRIFTCILNGRSTLIRVDKPLILSDLIKPNINDSEVARRAVWVLRTHFQRCRQAILGPDLSHRRTLMQQVLSSPEIKRAITQTALTKGLTPAQVEQHAEGAIDSIVADFSPSTARILNHLIHFMLNRLFDRINLKGLDQIQQLALTDNLIYLPCHRSHLDYILLSWLLYRHGLMVPHVAAGDNLNFPIVGGILRRGGAIFMRRSFKEDPLYALIFKQYLTLMLHRGHSIEYFIEGGRSRSGRLLTAKTGLLKMTLDAWQQAPERPLAFLPVSISYDRLVESQSYQQELSGGRKVRENLLDTLKSLRILFLKYGEVSISFGQPIRINAETMTASQIPSPAVLGRQVLERINLAFSASQMSIIGSVLLSAPRLQMREVTLIERIEQFMLWLAEEGVSLPPGEPKTWITNAAERLQISRGKNAIAVSEEQAAELTFYRNMLMHKLILPGLVLLFHRRLALSGSRIQTRLIRAIYPYIRAELSLPDPSNNLDLTLIHTARKQLEHQHLLVKEDQPLPALAEHFIRLAEPVLLRQYLLILVMSKLQLAGEIELFETTRELALHIHQHYGYAAPEYADKRVFEGVTEQLIEQGIFTGHAEQLRLTRPLDKVLMLGEKIFPAQVIEKSNLWLKQKGIST